MFDLQLASDPRAGKASSIVAEREIASIGSNLRGPSKITRDTDRLSDRSRSTCDSDESRDESR